MAFHYPSRHAFHPPNFQGIVDALVECNATLSGVGTNSFTLDPSGYTSNFAGVVKAIEDFNISLSGVQGSTQRTFTAGETLNQGEVVYVSGLSVFKASALSGIAPFNYQAIGIVENTQQISAGNPCSIVLNGETIVSGAAIVDSTFLTPGQTYYLAKYPGKVTPYSSASGFVTNSGTDQYQALVVLGKATTSQHLDVEIEPPIILFE